MSRAKRYQWAAVAAAGTAVAAGVVAWAAPASTTEPAPTTRPVAPAGGDHPAPAAVALAVVTTPAPMSAAFAGVRHRSIFLKGEQVLADAGGPSAANANAPRPESVLAFTGVTMIDGRADALIEDTAAHRFFTVKVGDPLAGGAVAGITFDELSYLAGGRLTRVGVGQTLDGGAAPAGGSATESAGSPTSTLGVTSGMSPEDILARMRKRREQELGGK